MDISARPRHVRRRAALAAVAVLAALVPIAEAPAHQSVASADQVIRLRLPDGSAPNTGSRSVFRAKTEGSPQATIVGGWSENQTAANEGRLTFGGGHALGARTSFFGTWVSPLSTSSKKPSMNIRYEVAYSNALGDKIPIEHAVRARFAGGRWGPWAVAKTPIAPARSSVASGNVAVVVVLRKPRRVQFQWKITGSITGPAALEGDFSVAAN